MSEQNEPPSSPAGNWGLEHLATELLNAILDEITWSTKRQDYWSLSLTPRRLSIVTELYLYAEYEWAFPTQSTKRNQLLRRTLESRPQLGSWVKKLTFDHTWGRPGQIYPSIAPDNLQTFFPMALYAEGNRRRLDRHRYNPPEQAFWALRIPRTPLETLEQHRGYPNGIEVFAPRSFLDGFSALTELTLLFGHEERSLYATICPELLQLPTLRKLTVFDDHVLPSVKNTWEYLMKTSPITDVVWSVLDSDNYSEFEDHGIVELFAALKSLRAVVPEYVDLGLFRSLASQKDSLEVLQLMGGVDVAYHLMPSIQDYPRLRHLCLSDFLLWGERSFNQPICHTAPQGVHVRHLGSVLPRSLETMTHMVFIDGGEPEINTSSYLSWYQSLWNERGTALHFSSLSIVVLVAYKRRTRYLDLEEDGRWTIWCKPGDETAATDLPDSKFW